VSYAVQVPAHVRLCLLLGRAGPADVLPTLAVAPHESQKRRMPGTAAVGSVGMRGCVSRGMSLSGAGDDETYLWRVIREWWLLRLADVVDVHLREHGILWPCRGILWQRVVLGRVILDREVPGCAELNVVHEGQPSISKDSRSS
jgi:hypothetical protein